MRLGIISTIAYNARSTQCWSGLAFFIARALRNAGLEQIDISVPIPLNRPFDVLYHRLLYKVHRKKYLLDRSPSYMRRLRRQLARKMAAADVHAIFAPSSIPIAAAPGALPAFFWTDATFPAIHGYYSAFSNLAHGSINRAIKIDRSALSRTAAAFYCSDWAANSAREMAPEDAAKIFTIPFGANLEQPPTRTEALSAIAGRQRETLRFLWIGVDWTRKGGDVAVAVIDDLRTHGQLAELEVVGCQPPPAILNGRPWIHSHGYISKEVAGGQAVISQLMLSSDWFILPSRAECFGVVFAEAAAHALPSLATRTGGIPSAIKDGQSGRLFDLGAAPSLWADQVRRVSTTQYKQLAESSRSWYDQTVNWETSGRTVVQVIETFLEAKPHRPNYNG